MAKVWAFIYDENYYGDEFSGFDLFATKEAAVSEMWKRFESALDAYDIVDEDDNYKPMYKVVKKDTYMEVIDIATGVYVIDYCVCEEEVY